MKKRGSEITKREIEVVELMAQGMRAKETAEKLGLSVYTVRTHIRNLYERLNCTNFSHVVYTVLNSRISTLCKQHAQEDGYETILWNNVSDLCAEDFDRLLIQYDDRSIYDVVYVCGKFTTSGGSVLPTPKKWAHFPKGPKDKKSALPG